MAGREQVEFTFPTPDGVDDDDAIEIEIEPSSATELDLSATDEAPPAPVVDPEPAIEVIEEDDDLDVEVYNDVPKKDRNRKTAASPEEVTDDELAEYSEKVQKRIKHFSKGYHDERRAKEQAQRENTEAIRIAEALAAENKRLKESVNKNQEALLAQARKGATAELEQAKSAYKSAYEGGDSTTVMEANQQLNAAQIKVDKLNSFKIPSNEAPETPVAQPEVAAPVPVDERANQWASKNTWFGEDTEMTAFALGVHDKLAKGGYDLQSDEYYEAVDARMRQVFPEHDWGDEDTEVNTPPPRKKSTDIVAPVSRGTAPKKVKLSRTQVALAKKIGVPLSVYAREAAEEAQRNG